MTEKQDYIQSAIKKLKMVDAGIIDKYPDLCCNVKDSKKPQKRYPCLYLQTNGIDKMFDDVDVGSSKKLVVEAFVRSHSLSNRDGQKKNETFDLEIRKIGLI
jgi:hypothetical protein